MKKISFLMLISALASTSVFAEVKCSDVKYGTDNYFDKMEELSKKAKLSSEGLFSKYHEEVVSILCENGEVKDIEQMVTNGLVKPSDPEKIAKVLGKNYKRKKEVVVPDITKDCSIDADQLLKKAGLVPRMKAIHGPIDKDASDAGCAYRQDPKAGTVVKKGTKVTYRSWWEAG